MVLFNGALMLRQWFIIFISLLLLSNCIGIVQDELGKKDEPVDSRMLSLIASGLAGTEIGDPVGGGEATNLGTTILSDDGRFRIDIPEGAVPEGESPTFSIRRIATQSNVLPTGFMPTSSVYRVTPSYAFLKDVRITIVQDPATIAANGLQQSRSLGFSWSQTQSTPEVARFPGWAGHDSTLLGDSVSFKTRTFSIFGTGAPQLGNHPPVIFGAFYSFEPGCSFVPGKVRAQVRDPEGDSLRVLLNVGPANAPTNLVEMQREGASDWYSIQIPIEGVSADGLQMQILAVDSYGANNMHPDQDPFRFPEDSGNSVFQSQFSLDADNDSISCLWESRNGYSDGNGNDVVSLTDSDSDGIPDVSDHTPNGEQNPVIDTLELFPSDATMNIGEHLVVGVRATFGGQPRFVRPLMSVSGNSLSGDTVASLALTVLSAQNPGSAAIQAQVNAISAEATVIVRDTIGPDPIQNLSAMALSHTRVQLRWTAPGNDGHFGKASGYQIRYSTSPITNTSACTSGTAVVHSIVPRTGGIAEILELDGLAPATTYYFCVLAYDPASNFNDWTQGAVSATTAPVPDLTPPADINDGVIANANPNDVTLSWTASGDDGAMGTATSYDIRKSLSPIDSDADCEAAVSVVHNATPVPAGSALSTVVSGLSDETTYFFCIRAYDESNNHSSWNSLLWATTPRGNRPPIASIQSVSAALPGVTLELNASDSTDPDGQLCSANTSSYEYRWELISRPPGSVRTTGDISDRDKLVAHFTPDVAGSYKLQFTFTDDAGSCRGSDRSDTEIITFSALESIPGTGEFNFQDISLATGLLNIINPEIILNSQTGEVLVVLNNSATGKPALVTCDSNGNDCIVADISAGRGSSVCETPRPVIDYANQKLIVTCHNRESGSDTFGAVRCNMDGSDCTYTHLANFLEASPVPLIDAQNNKLLIVTSSYEHNRRPRLIICSLDLNSCNNTDLSAGQGDDSARELDAIIDELNGKLLVVGKNFANSLRPSLFRCNLDGTGCVHSDISGGDSTTALGSLPSIGIDYDSNKLIVATAPTGTFARETLHIGTCDLDGANCTFRDLEMSQGTGSATALQLLVDTVNGHFLVVVHNAYAQDRPGIYRCDFEQTNCTYRTIDAAGRNGSGFQPSAVLDESRGKLLFITRTSMHATLFAEY